MTHGGLSTLRVGLTVVDMLVGEGPLTVDQVRDRLGVSRSSAYRLLRTLVDAGWAVEQGRGHYRLNGALGVMMRSLEGPSVREAALPHLHDLCKSFSETVTLSVKSGLRRIPIDQVTPNREVVMAVELGKSWPLHAGASGRAILAAMEPRHLQRYIESTPLESIGPNTITDPLELTAAIDRERARGYTAAVAERDGDAFGIASAFSIAGSVAGSIAVCGPASRYSEELARRVGPIVAHHARALSDELTHAR